MMMKIMIINIITNNQEIDYYKIFKNINVRQKKKLKRNKQIIILVINIYIDYKQKRKTRI